MRSQFLALLAEVHGKMGQADEGLMALAEALAAVDKTGERRCEAELYRLRGELTLQQHRRLTPRTLAEAEAEAYFHKAIGIAYEQEAKSLELRATTSLARLLDKQGKRGEARKMLAEIYNWFTEGFDTVDMKEAKALLDELSS